MGKYKPETDSQGLCAAGATGCVDYTCTDCAGDRPCFHTHTQILTHAHTLAHANTDARCCRSVPARPLPHRLRRVAVPCCRLLKHAHPSCAKPWRASATSCMGPLARRCTLFRSNTTIGGRPRRRFASTQARRRGQLRAVCGGLLQGVHQRGPARPLSLKRRSLARGSPATAAPVVPASSGKTRTCARLTR